MVNHAAGPEVDTVPIAAKAGDPEHVLARSEQARSGIAPVLRHLIANDHQPVLSDEIVARVRGMTADLARQIAEAFGPALLQAGVSAEDAADGFASDLLDSSPLLQHLHGIALEWILIERMQFDCGIDPVRPPLVQALIASHDATTAALGMKVLAAQARFAQAQRRMQLPVAELPGELLHAALLAMRMRCLRHGVADAAAENCDAAVRNGFDEAGSRTALLEQAIGSMGHAAVAALAVQHAGVPIFLSAVAFASGQDRDLAVFAAAEGQGDRLALALRAAGLKTSEIAAQMTCLDPMAQVPVWLERCDQRMASEILGRDLVQSGDAG